MGRRPDPSRPKVAILDTHPSQYRSSWYRALARRPDLDLFVLYCHWPGPREHAESGFAVEFQWYVPVLEGYRSEFLPNAASNPRVSVWGLNTPNLSRRIAVHEYDAVVVNGWHYRSAWQAIFACWRSGTPVLVLSDSHLKTPRSLIKAAAKWPVYRLFIPRLDGCLAVGTLSREYFLHYGAYFDRIFEVPHSVDMERFSRVAQKWAGAQTALREKWQLPINDSIFLFVGKFIPKKRPLDFVLALAEARRGGAKVFGLMVGDGILRRACFEAAKVVNAPIGFSGFLNQQEIVEAYIAADALVVTSDAETWGVAVNEAMTCSRPCFLSDCVGCGPDLVAEGRSGFIFPCGNTRRLADLIQQQSDRRSLAVMGQHARQIINKYSPEVAADRLALAVATAIARHQNKTAPYGRRRATAPPE